MEFEYNDVETDELSTIKVLTLPENGQLVFDGVELQLIEENPETVIEVDQLDLLTFRPALNWFGETDFLICVNDDGQTIFGLDENGEETDVTPYGEAISVIVGVTAFNDPPTISEPTIQTEENLIYTFKTEDFQINYIDPEGDQLAYLRIETLPENGQLILEGFSVDSGQVIDVGQIGLLQFIPAEDWFGTTEFSCSLSDDGEVLEGESYAIFGQPVPVLIAVSEDDNQSPELTRLLLQTVTEGESVNFNLVEFIDPDPRDEEIRLANINWGDETEDIEVEVVLEDPQTGRVIFPHTFKNEGLYLVQVTVLDGRGGIGTEIIEVEVEDQAPTFVVDQTEINGQEGVPVDLADFQVYLSDLGIEDSHNITIDWG